MDFRITTMEELREEILRREANPPPTTTACTTCDGAFVSVDTREIRGVRVPAEWQTLVGYEQVSGHDHDDNCKCRTYRCALGHATTVAIRRRCSTPGCTWTGKKTCSCHDGSKVDAWPVV